MKVRHYADIHEGLRDTLVIFENGLKHRNGAMAAALPLCFCQLTLAVATSVGLTPPPYFSGALEQWRGVSPRLPAGWTIRQFPVVARSSTRRPGPRAGPSALISGQAATKKGQLRQGLGCPFLSRIHFWNNRFNFGLSAVQSQPLCTWPNWLPFKQEKEHLARLIT